METHRIFKMSFASVLSALCPEGGEEGRERKHVDEVICWLTGYSPQALATQIKQKKDFEMFFNEAPSLHPNASKITGVICGVRIEEIENPLMERSVTWTNWWMSWRRAGHWTRSCASDSPAAGER